MNKYIWKRNKNISAHETYKILRSEQLSPLFWNLEKIKFQLTVLHVTIFKGLGYW